MDVLNDRLHQFYKLVDEFAAKMKQEGFSREEIAETITFNESAVSDTLDDLFEDA